MASAGDRTWQQSETGHGSSRRPDMASAGNQVWHQPGTGYDVDRVGISSHESMAAIEDVIRQQPEDRENIQHVMYNNTGRKESLL